MTAWSTVCEPLRSVWLSYLLCLFYDKTPQTRSLHHSKKSLRCLFNFSGFTNVHPRNHSTRVIERNTTALTSLFAEVNKLNREMTPENSAQRRWRRCSGSLMKWKRKCNGSKINGETRKQKMRIRSPLHSVAVCYGASPHLHTSRLECATKFTITNGRCGLPEQALKFVSRLV